jgi:hypothetical protein
MQSLYVQLIGIGVNFLSNFISSLTTNKAPQEVLDAIQAAITALEAHKADVMSKADWESLRG